MERPPAILTSPEPDRAHLTRVVPEVVAHIWGMWPRRERAEEVAQSLRGVFADKGACPSCGAAHHALRVNVVERSVSALGATAYMWVVVLRHTR